MHAAPLIDELERHLAVESSLFRAQLLREDIARLRQLDALARSSLDAEGYRRAGRRLSWTASGARTHELDEALERLLDAVRATQLEDGDTRVREAWSELTRLRLQTMVGCLSTPVPKPGD